MFTGRIVIAPYLAKQEILMACLLPATKLPPKFSLTKQLNKLTKALRGKANTVTRNNNMLTTNIDRFNKAEKIAHFGSFEWEI